MAKKTKPVVTVIVSFYNSGPHLDNCLEQLRQLDLAGHQLILIDDASTDDTLQRLRASEFADAVISNPTNLGVAGTRNRALELATGDYIWLVDHDDEWEPQILDELLQLAVEYDADIAVCAAEYRDGTTGKLLSVLEQPAGRRVLTREEAVRSLIEGKLQGYTWNKLFRHDVMPKEAYQSIYEPKEDLARLILTLEHCERVAVMPDVLYRHLDFATAVTRRMNPNLEPYERCYEMARDLVLACGATTSNTSLLRSFAYYQFIGPSIGTALSRDALQGSHSETNLALLKRARAMTRWRELPGVMLRFPVQGLLAAAFKVLGFRLMWLYRLLRLS